MLILRDIDTSLRAGGVEESGGGPCCWNKQLLLARTQQKSDTLYDGHCLRAKP